MSFEDRLRDDLQAVIGPAPQPPPNLADLALAGARRQSYRRATVSAGLALVAVSSVTAAASGVLTGDSPSTTPSGAPTLGPSCLVDVTPPATPPSIATPSGDPVFPAPGGGPRAVEVYGTRFSPDAGSYLLDREDGTYHALPWLVSVSPNGAQVAVFDDAQGRVGLADRSALLAHGEEAITWLELPRSNGPLWSPDGTALLSTTTFRDETDRIRFTVHRYDIATGEQTSTPVPWGGDELVASRVGWAADSQRYVALVREIDDQGRVVAGRVQYLYPDGSPGDPIDVPGGLVGGAEAYSPSRRHVILDTSGVMLEQPACSRIVDVLTGQAAVVFAPGETPVGWYSDTAFVRQKDGALQVVDLATLAVLKEVDLSGLGTLAPLQLGPSDGTAAAGF